MLGRVWKEGECPLHPGLPPPPSGAPMPSLGGLTQASSGMWGGGHSSSLFIISYVTGVMKHGTLYQARLGMCERWSLPIRAPHGNEQVGQEASSRFLQTSLERGAEAGLGSAGGGQPAVIACYLWEPRGRKGAGFGAPCTTAGWDQLWLQGGLGHSWSCHNIDPGGDNIQRAWSPSRIRRGMSPEKMPGPQGDQTKWGFNRSLPAQISWVIGSRS